MEHSTAEPETLATETAGWLQSWCGFSLDGALPVSEEEIAAAERELGVTFPKSYRSFLRYYGGGDVYYYQLFGLPRDRLWGNVVMMNQLSKKPLPGHYIKVTDRIGDHAYYLDTSKMDAEGECPVVVFGRDGSRNVVADSFRDFLRNAAQGLI